jgi:NADPH:quinone reductase-like Zn-dependent oxidoreductase
VNPVDVMARQSGVFVGEPPFVLGWDVSGTVETVGLGVTLYQPGDEVFGMLPFPQGHGGYAQHVVAPAVLLLGFPVHVGARRELPIRRHAVRGEVEDLVSEDGVKGKVELAFV